MLNRLAGLCLASCLLASAAWAGPDPVVRNDVGVCDPNAPTNCLAPGLGDSGSTPVQVQTPGSAPSAGQPVGGSTGALGALFVIPAARLVGGSGELENLLWISSGGSTVQLLVRIWDKKPVNTTCQGGAAFVSSATDDQHLLTAPFTITPAAPANTTGDAKTYATNAWAPPISYANQDSPATKYVYACVVATATDTADNGNAVVLNLTGPQG